VSAEIPEKVSVGPLFLAFIVMMFLIVAQILVKSIILKWAISIGWIFVFISLFAKIAEKQLKGGPAVAQFRRRMARVWVSVDGDELVVRTSKKVEGYKPSRIEWKTVRSFVVVEGETNFELVFSNPADATMFVSRIKTNAPGIQEVPLPMSLGPS
jgi:hypothetical protein